MTHFEIYQIVKRLIPSELRERYDHLCYGEMAEVAELSQWAEALRWAEEQWEKIELQDELQGEPIIIDENSRSLNSPC